VAAGRGEVAVVILFEGRFVAAPTEGNGRDPFLAPRVIDRVQQIVGRGGARLDEENVRARGDGMGPFDVEGNFQSPAGIDGRARSGRGFGEDEITVGIFDGQVESFAEDAQVVVDVGGVVGIDDGDGLA